MISLELFLSNQSSSPFQKMGWNFSIFNDYVIAYDVIGHDDIGHPVVRTDSSGLALFGIKNRLVIGGLQKKWWPI